MQLEQLVVITEDAQDINAKLVFGWLVKTVTAQHVAVSTGNYTEKMGGKFCFILEREKTEL